MTNFGGYEQYYNGFGIPPMPVFQDSTGKKYPPLNPFVQGDIQNNLFKMETFQSWQMATMADGQLDVLNPAYSDLTLLFNYLAANTFGDSYPTQNMTGVFAPPNGVAQLPQGTVMPGMTQPSAPAQADSSYTQAIQHLQKSIKKDGEYKDLYKDFKADKDGNGKLSAAEIKEAAEALQKEGKTYARALGEIAYDSIGKELGYNELQDLLKAKTETKVSNQTIKDELAVMMKIEDSLVKGTGDLDKDGELDTKDLEDAIAKSTDDKEKKVLTDLLELNKKLEAKNGDEGFDKGAGLTLNNLMQIIDGLSKGYTFDQIKSSIDKAIESAPATPASQVTPVVAPVDTTAHDSITPVVTPVVAPVDTTAQDSITPVVTPVVAPVDTTSQDSITPVVTPVVAPVDTTSQDSITPVVTPVVAPVDTTAQDSITPVVTPVVAPVDTTANKTYKLTFETAKKDENGLASKKDLDTKLKKQNNEFAIKKANAKFNMTDEQIKKAIEEGKIKAESKDKSVAQVVADVDSHIKSIKDRVEANIVKKETEEDGRSVSYYDKNGEMIMSLYTSENNEYHYENIYEYDDKGREVSHVYIEKNEPYFYDGEWQNVDQAKTATIKTREYKEDGSYELTVKTNDATDKLLENIVENHLSDIYKEWISDTDIYNKGIVDKIAKYNNIENKDDETANWTEIKLPLNKDFYGLKTGEEKKAEFAKDAPEGFNDPEKIEIDYIGYRDGKNLSEYVAKHYKLTNATTIANMVNLIAKANNLDTSKMQTYKTKFYLPDEAWANEKIAQWESQASRRAQIKEEQTEYSKLNQLQKAWKWLGGSLEESRNPSPEKPVKVKREKDVLKEYYDTVKNNGIFEKLVKTYPDGKKIVLEDADYSNNVFEKSYTIKKDGTKDYFKWNFTDEKWNDITEKEYKKIKP